MLLGSLFAGIGGFDLAFENAGFDVRWQVENDEHCRYVLEKHWPDVERFSDITRIEKNKLPSVDVIVGGFPCQDVSFAGSRAGLAGGRSRLWWNFAQVLEDKRPKWTAIENVVGLLSSNGGRDMGTILWTLGELGYGFAYRVLDAQWFGLPQRRKRVFIVGCLDHRTAAAEVLLEPASGGGNPSPRNEQEEVVAALTRDGVGTANGPDDNTAQARHLVPYRKLRRASNSHESPESWGEAAVANTLDAGGNATRTSHAVLHTESVGVRRLMPLECERLQGFPDGFTDGQLDTHRYKQLGNAVAVPVAEWIGKRILQWEKGELESSPPLRLF